MFELPPKEPIKVLNKPTEARTEVQPTEQPFWAKLLKIREYQAICKVHVYQDANGKEYKRVDTIIEIDRNKKKQEKEDEKKEKTITTFLEDIEE